MHGRGEGLPGLAAALPLAALLLLPGAARGGNDLGLRVGPVEAVGGVVCVSWEVQHPFTPKLLETLEQGMPARVVYEVGVWKHRSFWFDKLVVAIKSEQKVVYDPVNGRYRIRSGTGPPRETAVALFDSLHARLFMQSRLALVLASELDSTGAYYVSVRTTIRPLSAEDLAEVEGWLAGGRSDGVRHGLPDYLIALAGSLSGLGDRTALEKSERWKPARLAAPYARAAAP
jgi:Domain of unknown function (DUF4390)